MKENLNIECFNNGDSIKNAKTNEEWITAIKNREPAWCYYENISVSDSSFGKLYNWYAVNDSRGLAPKGWHIPSKDEFNELILFLSKSGNIEENIKSQFGWDSDNNGKNQSGFNAYPVGGRDENGFFGGRGVSAFFWSSSEQKNNVSIMVIKETFGLLDLNQQPYQAVEIWNTLKTEGYSVRCIKD
jgi:uncharacterized protein (TIGR02145 family)